MLKCRADEILNISCNQFHGSPRTGFYEANSGSIPRGTTGNAVGKLNSDYDRGTEEAGQVQEHVPLHSTLKQYVPP
jgi:hypothetical protein